MATFLNWEFEESCLFQGYDDLTQGPAGTDYSKGYSNSSQTQAKSAGSGPGKGKRIHSRYETSL